MNDRARDLAMLAKNRASERTANRATGAKRDGRPAGTIDHGLDLAVIGNGRTAALVDPCSRLVWWCYPRFDGDPIFCRMLSGREEKGFSDVLLDDMVEYQSQYVRNTAIVSTILTDRHGAKVRITDLAPRFRQFGRVFRPPQLYRIIEPLAGLPRITVRMRPTCDYGKALPHRSLGSNHIRYADDSTVIRLTTDAPLSLIDGEAPFVLTRPLHLVFGPDEPFTGDLQTTCRDFIERTHDYWMDWVRRLSISYDWQEAIIRAAITLKLSNFDETGAVVAAHTTSIPEAPSSGRTWDYRYCWLRDAYFVVQALNRIGATRTMEEFISFTLSIAAKPEEELRPLYKAITATGRCGSAMRPSIKCSMTPMAASFSPRCRCFSIAACRGPATKDCFICWNRSASAPPKGPSCRTPASGNIAAGNASTPTPRRCAGPAVSGLPPSPCGSDSNRALNSGTASPSRCMRNWWSGPGTRSAAPLPRHSAPTTSMPACSFLPISAWSKSTTRALPRRSRRWSANWCAKST